MNQQRQSTHQMKRHPTQQMQRSSMQRPQSRYQLQVKDKKGKNKGMSHRNHPMNHPNSFQQPKGPNRVQFQRDGYMDHQQNPYNRQYEGYRENDQYYEEQYMPNQKDFGHYDDYYGNYRHEGVYDEQYCWPNQQYHEDVYQDPYQNPYQNYRHNGEQYRQDQGYFGGHDGFYEDQEYFRHNPQRNPPYQGYEDQYGGYDRGYYPEDQMPPMGIYEGYGGYPERRNQKQYRQYGGYGPY